MRRTCDKRDIILHDHIQEKNLAGIFLWKSDFEWKL